MILIDVWLCSRLVYKYESYKIFRGINHHWWSNTFVNFFFFKALLEIKEENAKGTTKCSQYNMTITIVDEV